MEGGPGLGRGVDDRFRFETPSLGHMSFPASPAHLSDPSLSASSHRAQLLFSAHLIFFVCKVCLFILCVYGRRVRNLHATV